MDKEEFMILDFRHLLGEQCKELGCREPVASLGPDKSKPSIPHFKNKKKKFPFTFNYPLIYSNKCYYHLALLESEKLEQKLLEERKRGRAR